MELPKNITQVGEADKSCKIYVEDYVMSYMKQMNRFAEDKEIAIALYGKRSAEQALTYCFVYGACKLDFLQREVRHLSQAQNQEIERLRRKYFVECEFVGYVILNGEMIEGVHISEHSGCHYVKGYACFYEKNDNMLAYMLDTRMEEVRPEVLPQEKYEQVRMRQEERKSEYTKQDVVSDRKEEGKNGRELEKHLHGMRFAVASMFVLLCLIGTVTFQTEGLGKEVELKVKRLFHGLLNQQTEVDKDIEVMSNDVINTLVAEEQLAAAIQQENQITPLPTEMSTPEPEALLTEMPTPLPTPLPTAVPTPLPTPEPTPIPTVVPTEAPTEMQVQSQSVSNAYVIKRGDTLIGISSRYYGSEKYVDDICELNKISNPDNIEIGQKILLP